MIVPLLLVMRRHSLLLPKNWTTTAGVFGIIVVSLVGAIGTFARTALVALAVGGTSMWLRSKRKLSFLLAALVMGGIMFTVTSDRWAQRISTISDYESESSAFVRILVWRWTWEFAQSHPFGGGFWAYTTNRIEIPSNTGGEPLVQFARAYHNIYFAVLGDQGYPGLMLYMTMVLLTLLALRKTRKLLQGLPEHLWCVDLAQALQVSILTMLAVGMFVEIGWTPIIWYLFSMSVCVRAYARRVLQPVTLPQRGMLAPMRPALSDRPEFGRKSAWSGPVP
jgi:probable O-glycosylation ligase (exosortase A-associated)